MSFANTEFLNDIRAEQQIHSLAAKNKELAAENYKLREVMASKEKELESLHKEYTDSKNKLENDLKQKVSECKSDIYSSHLKGYIEALSKCLAAYEQLKKEGRISCSYE